MTRNQDFLLSLPGYYAFTGSDCTSSFYRCVSTLRFHYRLFTNFLCCVFVFLRKGKVKPFEIVEKDDSNRFVNFFISLGERPNREDLKISSEFVCRIYAHNCPNGVVEPRHKKLIQMSGNINQVMAITYACFSL